MIFFDRANKIMRRLSIVFQYRVPLGPVRPQEVSGSLIPAPSLEGVGTTDVHVAHYAYDPKGLELGPFPESP